MKKNITHVNVICCVTFGVCKTQHYKITQFFVFLDELEKEKINSLVAVSHGKVENTLSLPCSIEAPRNLTMFMCCKSFKVFSSNMRDLVIGVLFTVFRA